MFWSLNYVSVPLLCFIVNAITYVSRKDWEREEEKKYIHALDFNHIIEKGISDLFWNTIYNIIPYIVWNIEEATCNNQWTFNILLTIKKTPSVMQC